MIFFGGRMTFAQITSQDVSARNNLGAVTITAPGATVCTLNLGALLLGDHVLLAIAWDCTKGGVAGTVSFSVTNTGGGTITWADNQTATFHDEVSLAAAAFIRRTYAALGRVIGAGTITLNLRGQSAGSDSTVSIDAGQLRAWVVPAG